MNRPRDDSTGSAAVEVVVLAPVVLGVVLLLCAFGRLAEAHQQTDDAARAAASTAALMSSPSGAAWAAGITTAVSTEGSNRQCLSPRVETDTSHFVPGGSVTVTIYCSVSFGDLGLFGSQQVQVSASAPIDPYRQVGR